MPTLYPLFLVTFPHGFPWEISRWPTCSIFRVRLHYPTKLMPLAEQGNDKHFSIGRTCQDAKKMEAAQRREGQCGTLALPNRPQCEGDMAWIHQNKAEERMNLAKDFLDTLVLSCLTGHDEWSYFWWCSLFHSMQHIQDEPSKWLVKMSSVHLLEHLNSPEFETSHFYFKPLFHSSLRGQKIRFRCMPHAMHFSQHIRSFAAGRCTSHCWWCFGLWSSFATC